MNVLVMEVMSMDLTMMDVTAYFAKAAVSLTNVFQEHILAEHKLTHIHTQSSAFIFPVSGKAWVHSGREKFFITPGRILHIHERETLHIENCGEQDVQFIVAQYQVAIRSDDDLYDDAFVLRVSDTTIYLEDAVRLLDMQALPGAMAALQRRTLFFQLIERCMEGVRDQQLQSTVDVMESIVAYIQQYYREKINVTKIAEKFQIERRRLAYLFEKHTGLSPNAYITAYRISKAKELLERVDLSIAEVAERVGYDDCFYFSRVFKKQTGYAPSTYRRKQIVAWTTM